MDEIIREANIAKGTFYYYFKSKEQMPEEVIGMMIEEEARKARLILNSDQQVPRRIMAIMAEFRLARDEQAIGDALNQPENILMHEKTNRKIIDTILPLLSEVVEEGVQKGIFCCLAAFYGILLLLPQKISLFFYLIFGVSAFLFCIGFFRLGFTFDAPAGSKQELFVGFFYAVSGMLINAASIYSINQDQGSGRSIMVATLLLIEALVLFAMAGSGFKTPGAQRRSAITFRIAGVSIVVIGAAFTIWKHFTTASMASAAMLLIEGICLWEMGGGSNPFNSLNSEIQTVPGLRTPIVELQQVFADVETQLGYPWIGRIETIKQDSVIYGPSEDGFFYGYYLFGRFYVAGSTNPLFPKAEDAVEHVVKEVPDSSGVLLEKEELPEAYVNMFTRYAESGKALWAADHPDNRERC